MRSRRSVIGNWQDLNVRKPARNKWVSHCLEQPIYEAPVGVATENPLKVFGTKCQGSPECSFDFTFKILEVFPLLETLGKDSLELRERFSVFDSRQTEDIAPLLK